MAHAPGDPDDPRSSRGPLTYAASGVDIDAGHRAVERMKAHVATTRRPEQLDAIGGFAGLFRMPAGLADPVLVGCTDGVGSKLLVAIALDRHNTVGIDLVAMNVNDLLVTGAEPLFVLDYVGVRKVDPVRIEAIVAGICEGCRRSGAALLGGETAELPDLYAEGHYDLAATAIGVVEGAKILGAQRVRIGDVVLALPSSGLHSNGYSLARRALLDPRHAGLSLHDALPGDPTRTVGDALLEPTRIYAAELNAIRRHEGLHAAAHITGGGLIDNPPRALGSDQAVELDLREVARPAVQRVIAAQGVSEDEQRRTFNCGVGMLLFVAADAADAVADAVTATGQTVQPIGRVIPRARADGPQVVFVGDT